MKKPRHTKAIYQSLIFDGYTWQGFWKGFHHFVKHEIGKGFADIRCTDKDIEDGNIRDMVLFGVTK